MLITSLDNKKIKKYLKLKNKKYRDSEKLFLIEGTHLIEEAIKNNLLVDLLVLEGENFNYSYEITYVSSNIMKKLSNMESIPSVIGVVKFLEPKEITGNKVLILDDIQDPGNLGTIIRSSLAFNVSDIILSINSVDLYNDKVIRSTQGMLFKVNIIRSDLKDIILNLKQDGYTILGTDVKDGIDVKELDVDKFALVMGNEGQGVSREIKSMCDKNLYIKMNSRVESLNVGVATSILLYELNR
ncbi:MAG: RNA methyltransferase [Bacilli bacterium]|nr:RNA methyltransferase [Bacilli bacterium]